MNNLLDRLLAVIIAILAIAFAWITYLGLTSDTGEKPPEAVIREVVRAESVFVTDTVRLRKVLTRWDTVRARDTIVVDSIVYVPVQIVDSIVEACRPLPTSCETLVAAVRDSAAVVGRLPWQSVGVEWPLAVYYERDLARLRAGASLGVDADGRPRVAVRVGVRWR